MLNALTIDIEDYYHVSAFESVVRFEDWDQYDSRVERNTYRILELLDEHNVKATFFILGWIAERAPSLVRSIHELGHEIASHGYAHQRVYTQTADLFREETRKSKHLLEDIISKPISGYRAASYSITKKSFWALEILAEEGFKYDSSIFPIWHNLYGIPNYQRFSHVVDGNGEYPIAEFPLSTIRVAGFNIPTAGGGYLRLFPYAWSHSAIRRLNLRERQPAIVYFHPWEIDPDQPRIQAKWKNRLRHYTNQHGMERKLRKLLSHFRFGPMCIVYEDFLK